MPCQIPGQPIRPGPGTTRVPVRCHIPQRRGTRPISARWNWVVSQAPNKVESGTGKTRPDPDRIQPPMDTDERRFRFPRPRDMNGIGPPILSQGRISRQDRQDEHRFPSLHITVHQLFARPRSPVFRLFFVLSFGPSPSGRGQGEGAQHIAIASFLTTLDIFLSVSLWFNSPIGVHLRSSVVFFRPLRIRAQSVTSAKSGDDIHLRPQPLP